jgi:glutamine amidotransferase-like uncharacterized protein
MKIALFIHQPVCAVDSANGIIKALSPHYSFKLFSQDEVESSFFDDVDCVCFPGGFGDADRFDRLMKWNRDAVTAFVNRGGKYLGICMGAYWAGEYYFDLLPGIIVEQYIRRPDTCTRRPHPKAMSVQWMGNNERMYFYDGCAFVGDNLDVVATYRNSDPMAIIHKNIGVIGCHLESEHWWYDKKYLKPHWHENRHHRLLLNFVDKLMYGNKYLSGGHNHETEKASS